MLILGLDQFCLDVEFMTKRKVGMYWRVCWGIMIPILLIVIFIYFVITLPPLTYGVFELDFPTEFTGS